MVYQYQQIRRCLLASAGAAAVLFVVTGRAGVVEAFSERKPERGSHVAPVRSASLREQLNRRAYRVSSRASGTKSSRAKVVRADRQAITRLLKKRNPSSHVSQIDVQGIWAEATILDSPKEQTGYSALLKKVGGRWRLLLEGQDFTGAGKKFGVPRHLWKRWYLE